MAGKILRVVGFFCLSTALAWANPDLVRAAEVEVETSTVLYARIDAPNAEVRETAGASGRVIAGTVRGESYEVLKQGKNGWIKIRIPSGSGYILSNRATLFEKTREKADRSVLLRRQVVDYALQFVGGPYVYGGSDPHTGADCSGFTSYVMRRVAGVSLSHSAAAQSYEGQAVGVAEVRPGDLIFYGADEGINHVAIYMGDGKVVHASSAETGIRVSDWDYRPLIKAVNVLK